MKEIDDIEINLLIDAVYQRYGYDFRHYAAPSIIRRLNNYLSASGFTYISEIIPGLIRDESLFESFINAMSVSVTEMFRDPYVYREFRETIVEKLASFPRLNIWHAGCSTGEEVYSFAILLKEEGLYDRATIYATDFDSISLDKAREGIYPVENIRLGTENYRNSGGKQAFSDYYHSRYGKAIINNSLKEKIIFSSHNLASDGVFNQMHLIVCRNVLIYFNKALQNHVLKLFSNSLVHNGVLISGNKEDLMFSEVSSHFEVLGKKQKIYRKKGVFDALYSGTEL